ncbi:hypothetical protein PHSC3_000900 [Chlamydiales bacterium STE3]|nr:hypothetical protein PHSC3_000900 [Chlamydiales bacterium STE3]
MTCDVAIYRGSFDPPHKGHLESVHYALFNGIKQVTIIYKDSNPTKPFRTNDKIRKTLLKIMFKDMPNVIISKLSYKAALAELEANPTIAKIYHILGSDLINIRMRPIHEPSKLMYLVIPRLTNPLPNSFSVLNNRPTKIGSSCELYHQHNSSTKLRHLLSKRNFEEAKKGFPEKVFNYFLQQNIFIPSEVEYTHRAILQLVRKKTEEEIVTKQIIPVTQFPLTFHLGQDLGMTGLSGDILCFIKNKNGYPCMVVKVFWREHYRTRFDSELKGYAQIEALKVPFVKVPQIYFDYQEKGFAFIGMSFVSGKPLCELMFDSQEAIKLCAKANANLHLSMRSLVPEIPQDYICIFEKDIQAIFDKLEKNAFFKELTSKLRDHWSQLKQDFIKMPLLLSFTHGDPNHSNWLVDLDNECVTYIDLSHFHRSMSPKSKPIGFAINELEEALLTVKIAARSMGRYNEEKISEIQNIYKQEYFSHVPTDIATKEAQRYFATYWSLRVVGSILDKFLDPHQKKSLKYQVDICHKIESILSH